MSSPFLSFIIATHLRENDATEAINSILAQEYDQLEVIVIASPAGDTYEFLRNQFEDEERVTILLEDERQGPPAARNKAFGEAEGEIFVSLDDDAVFRDTDMVHRITEVFDENPNVGFLSFRSEDYETGKVIPHEIPKGPNGREPESRHETTYFVGVGAAFRAEAVKATSGFAEDFYYQMEELDLAFQMFREGYYGLYLPDIIVRHKHADPGRPSEQERWSRLLDNRLRVAIRHLPVWCIVTSAAVWTWKAMYETGSLRPIINAYQDVITDSGTLRKQREVIDRPTRRKMAALNGRIWY